MGLFRRRRDAFDLWARVRDVGPPDWDRISDRIGEWEERIAADTGWFVAQPMSPVDYGTDQPCTVFLTSDRIIIDVRPDTSLTTGPEVVEITMFGVEGAGAALKERGITRFVCVYATDSDIRSVAVDFEPRRSGAFIDSLVQWVPNDRIR